MKAQSYRIPPPLRAGDGVALAALSRHVTAEDVRPAVDVLQQHGYRVRLGRTIGRRDRCFAGSEAERAADFSELLADPSVRAVWLARGGYGAAAVLGRIDWTSLKNDPKWIVGFSDVTALHMHAQRCCQVATLHATMPLLLKDHCPQETASFSAALNIMASGTMPALSWPAWPWNRPGTAQGILVGGNLSVLASLAGSPSDLDPEGKILFLEDVDEYLYHIDRLMLMLRRRGTLERLAGIVIGGMTRMKDNDLPHAMELSAYEIIARRLEGYSFPVAFGAPAGHFPGQHPLMLGIPYRLDVSPTQTTLQPLT